MLKEKTFAVKDSANRWHYFYTIDTAKFFGDKVWELKGKFWTLRKEN